MKARLQVLAGEPSRDMMRSLAKKGPEPLAESERRRLALDKPLGAALDEAALSELEASHCGVVPKSAFGTMAYAQRYRDAHLADATLSAAVSGGSAVLITGNNHVRLDRGGGCRGICDSGHPRLRSSRSCWPRFARAKTTLWPTFPRDPDGKSIADYVILTPPAKRPDPCEMRKNAG